MSSGSSCPDVTNAIFSELMRGVEDEAHRRGYMVLLARAEAIQEGDDAIRRLIGEGRVDGVLVQAGDNMRRQDLESLVEGSLPVVFVNSVHPQSAGSVVFDDERGMRLGTQHLIDLGHSRIGFLSGVPTSDSAARREIGFRSAMAAAGLAVPAESVTHLGYDPRSGGLRSAARRPAGTSDGGGRGECQRGARRTPRGAPARTSRTGGPFDRGDARRVDGRERVAAADNDPDAAVRAGQGGDGGRLRPDHGRNGVGHRGDRPRSVLVERESTAPLSAIDPTFRAFH